MALQPRADSFPSIAAWTAGLPNVCLPPLILDVRDDGEWPLPGGMQPLAIYAANVTHISPWEVTQGLMSGASELCGVWQRHVCARCMARAHSCRGCCSGTRHCRTHACQASVLLNSTAAGRHLQPGGLLVLYGPFNVGGKHTSEGNAAFDVSLRARDPAWGLRDVEAVRAGGSAAAASHAVIAALLGCCCWACAGPVLHDAPGSMRLAFVPP